jgi:PKD repeat protein
MTSSRSVFRKFLLGNLVALLLIGAPVFQGCDPQSDFDFSRVKEGAADEQLMTFSASDLTYYSEGQEQDLTVFTKKFSARVVDGMMDGFKAWLEGESLVEKPLEINRLIKGIVAVSLNDDVTHAEILSLVRRLNKSGLVRYAGPMFTAPSVRTVLTDEIVVKFAEDVSKANIKAFITSAKLHVLEADHPMPRCYLLGFTSQSGANPLSVSRQLYGSNLVEYAHPNFMDWMAPPGGIDVDDEEPGEFVSERNAMLLYPNLFQEFEWIVTEGPMIPTGWEAITEEDFEGMAVLDGWSYFDDNPLNSLYYWGVVSDEEFPSLMGEGYEPDGNKGWVARHHPAGDPDRWPDMAEEPEGYAQNVDTWLVYGPMDLSDSLLARFQFQGAFYAPGTETFGWFVSLDGENWFGQEENGVGEQRKLSYWYPRYNSEPRHKGIYLDLTRLPELGDLAGINGVYVAFRFQSDGTITPKPREDDFSYYGIFLDNILVEHCADPGGAGVTADPLSKGQWGLRNFGQTGGVSGYDVNAPEAWSFLDQIPGATHPDDEENPVIVAVLDEGVDLDHEDLNLVPGFDATYEPETDPDHEDSQGGALPWDGHGTACAGIIGAKENGIGVVGVAPGVKIMPVRIAYSPEGENGWVTTRTQQVAGMLWAVENGAQILSNSWGGGWTSDVLEDGIRQVAEMESVVLFASGNSNHDYPSYPSSMEEVISVGAMSPCGERKNPDSCDGEWWWGSNYSREDASDGAQIDVMAPGVLNPTTDITGDGGYVPSNAETGKSGNYMRTFNGTSSACPHAAGVVALMLSANPGMDRETVRGILTQTAQDIGDEGWDYETGYGRVDAQAALTAAAQISGDLQISGSNLPECVYIDDTFPFDVTVMNDGAAATGPFYVQLYLSANSQIDDSDRYLWHGSVSLDAQAEEQVTANVQIPADADPGPYNLIVFVDGQETVFERNEDNNRLVHPVQVTYPPNLVVKPSTVDFGTVLVGSGAQKTLQIKNEGENELAPLVVSDISFSGDPIFDSPENLIPSTPLELETNESGQMWLYFIPESGGTFNGTVTITSNDPDEPVKAIPLSGEAVEPQPVLALDNVPVDFGEVATFGFFRIENHGNGDLEWSLDTSGMPAWITRVEPTSGTTAPDALANVELDVSRNLMSVGDYSWDLPVSSNGGNEAVHISLTVPGRTLSVTPESLDFGEDGITDTITLENTGGFGLNWMIVDDFPAWLQADAMSGGLDPGASADVHLSVDRSGLAAGSYDHTVQIGSNGGSAVVEVSMAVTGSSVPEVTVRAEPESGAAPLTVSFSADVTGGDEPLSYAWQFGDGETSVMQNPTHVYDTPQIYTARVTVTDIDGDSDGAEVTVTVTGGVWSRTYGHGDTYAEYHTYGLDALDDGGLVFIAESIFNGQGGYDFWVARLDADGALMWERGMGGSSGDYAKKVRQTSDGRFIVAGESYSYRTGSRYCDAWIVKFTDTGAVDWQHTYGGTGTDTVSDIRETFDGLKASTGYIAVGQTTSFGAGGYDVWVVKLDTQGAIEWEKSYGAGSDEFGRSVQPTPDGGFIVVGDTQSFGAGSRDVWVLKLSSTGTVEWEKTIGGAGSETPYAVQVADDDGYVIGATTASFVSGVDDDGDFWVMKLNAAGVLVWQYTYGGTEDESLRDLEKTVDGGYVMTGWTYSYGEPFYSSVYNSAWVVKIDGAGMTDWQKVYSYPYEDSGEIINAPDWAYAVVQTADGGYAVSGDAEWWSSDRNTDAWIFKVDGQGELGCGIGADTNAVPDGSAQVAEGTDHTYTAGDTTAVVLTPDVSPYASGPDVITQCP